MNHQIPKWVFQSSARFPDHPLIAAAVITGLSAEETHQLAPNMAHNLASIIDARKAFVQKWRMPPPPKKMKTQMGRKWAETHLQAWLRENNILADEETFQNARPKKIAFTPPEGSEEENVAWKEYFKYATEIAPTPAAFQQTIKIKTGFDAPKPLLADWEKIRRWATTHAWMPQNKKALDILDWTKTHTSSQMGGHPILIRAAYRGLSPTHLRLILKEGGHPNRSWPFEGVRSGLTKAQKEWFFPPSPWMMASLEGQTWALQQLKEYRRANPFPSTKQELDDWDGDVIPELVPVPDPINPTDAALIRKWLKTQHEE